jgi:gliding motility associated protien GldN
MKRFFLFSIASIFCVSISFAQDPAVKTEPVIKTESSAPSEDIYIDDIVAKRMTVESKVLSYEPVREADVAWEKRIWRLIDTREKMNLVWRAEEQPFFNILKDLLKNGDITVFGDEKFKEPLSYDDVEKKLVTIDTTEVFNSETYEQTIKVTKNTKDWRNITQFRVKEIWFFDEEASMLKNRIIGIAPMYSEIIEGVDRPLVYPLFYIYYPEARQYLAKYRVISDNNDVAPMTWADLLDNRYFTSIIYKKSNILDYKVEDFFDPLDEMVGIDKLMESEKIKQELFNFEHDLWEY